MPVPTIHNESHQHDPNDIARRQKRQSGIRPLRSTTASPYVGLVSCAASLMGECPEPDWHPDRAWTSAGAPLSNTPAGDRPYCRAVVGSIRVARRAGSHAATVVTVTTARAADAMTNGSVGSRPKSKDRR